METQPDFRDLLALLNSHKVEYLIVGGYALAFHGVPRFTGDIDILVKPVTFNAVRILSALQDFGFGSLDLTADDFTTLNNVIQLGISPVRIDFLTSISGVDWDNAYGNKVTGSYGDIPVFYIGLKEFEQNKLATGRAKDLADLEALGKHKPK